MLHQESGNQNVIYDFLQINFVNLIKQAQKNTNLQCNVLSRLIDFNR